METNKEAAEFLHHSRNTVLFYRHDMHAKIRLK